MSEVEEINVPEGWAKSPLRDISEKLVDGSHNPPKKQDSGFPMLSVRNIENGLLNWDANYRFITEEGFELEHRRTNIEADDVLLTIVGTIGRTCVVPKNAPKFTLQRSVAVIKPIEIDPKYICYQLQSSRVQHYLHKNSKGTAQKGIYLKGLGQLDILIAPPEQQKRIVAKIEELFSHIDAGIEALKKAKQLLKQYRQSVLKAAVTGELTKEWREANKNKLEPASQLLERILKERREKWEEQQLEQFKAKGKMPKDDKWKAKYKEASEFSSDIEVPENWIGVTTDQVFYYVTSGSRGWAKYYSEEGPVFLRMGNLEHFDVGLDLKDIQRVSPPEGAEGSRTKVEPGDSLISITADVGMVAIVPDDFEEAYINQHVSLARPVIRSMGLYLAWLLSGDFAKEQFKLLQRGATKVGLGLEDIKAIQFGLPSIEEQIEIVKLIEEKLGSMERLASEIDIKILKAGKNKQSILASAFSGELQ